MHVGQYGSAVVMTIILLITVLHKKKKRVTGCPRGCSFVCCPAESRLLLCMAEQLLLQDLSVVITKKKNFFFVISKVFFHQSGQSPKIIRAKGVGLERTDSQTVGEFPRGRRKGRYSTLKLKTFHSLTCSNSASPRLFACCKQCFVGFLLFLWPLGSGGD